MIRRAGVKNALRFVGVVSASFILSVSFNNCTSGFETLDVGSVTDLSSSLQTETDCEVKAEEFLTNAFKNTFHAQATKSCVACHGSFQSPKFATTDVAASFKAASGYIDLKNVEGSTLYIRARNGHCGGTCVENSPQSNEVVAALKAWSVAAAGAPSCALPPPDAPVVGPAPPPIVTPPVVVAPTPIPPVIALPPINGLSTKGSVGIQNFSEIAASMAAVTGIPITTPSVQLYYDDAITRMSLDGAAAGVTNSMMLTYTTMASVFCRELSLKETLLAPAERKFYSSIDFTKNLASITAAQKNQVITGYADVFWGRTASAEEVAVFNKLFTDLTGSLSALSDAEQTKAAMLLSCTSALSSLDFIIN